MITCKKRESKHSKNFDYVVSSVREHMRKLPSDLTTIRHTTLFDAKRMSSLNEEGKRENRERVMQEHALMEKINETGILDFYFLPL